MKLLTLRSLRAAVVLLIILAVSGVSVARDTDDEPRVPITIESRPDFAEIYLNGKFIGSAAITPRLAPGEHTIEVRRKGFETWKRQLTVLPGGQSRVVALLERQSQ